MNDVNKLIKIILLVFGFIIFLGILSLYQVLNPTLSSIQVNKKNEEGIYISPD